MQYSFTNEISILVVSAVRQYFANHALTADWRWAQDIDARKIEVLKQYPDTTRIFPLISVHVSHAGDAENYLAQAGERMLAPNGEWVGQYQTGTDNFDVQLTVYDYGKADVDGIGDALLWGLKGPIRKQIEEQSLFNVRPAIGVRFSGEGARQEADERLVYFVSYSQQMKSTWFDEVVYDQTILSYLTTLERKKLDDSTVTIQFKTS